MKTIATVFFVSIIALLISTSTAQANSLSGSTGLAVNDPANALWNVSGTYNYSVLGLAIDETLAMQPNGKFTGTATIDYTFYIGNIHFDFDFTGTVTTAGSIVKVASNMAGKGGIAIHTGANSDFTAKIALTLTAAWTVNEAGQSLDGTTGGTMTISVAKQIGMPRAVTVSTKLPKNAVSLDLNSNMDGTWDLNLSGVSLDSKNKYTGTAQIILSDGSTLNFNLSGTYTPKTQISTISFTGTGGAKGTNISGQFTYNSGFLHPFKKISGKVAGQQFALLPPS